jgi:hypothetical protein
MNDHKNSPDAQQSVNAGETNNYSFSNSIKENNNDGSTATNQNDYSDEYDSYTPWE